MKFIKLIFLSCSLFFTANSLAQESELSKIVSAIKENTKEILELNQYESDGYLSVRFIPVYYEGKVVDISELNETELEEISEIRLVFNDTVKLMFGYNGSKGVIIIKKLKPKKTED